MIPLAKLVRWRTRRSSPARSTRAIQLLSVGAVAWPPKVGDPLPRAAEAWSEPSKWTEWILAGRGHGSQWATVLHVNLGDVDLVWEAISQGVLADAVSRIRDLGIYGLNCEVNIRVTIHRRSAPVRTIWHYGAPDSQPRLVSAYPTP